MLPYYVVHFLATSIGDCLVVLLARQVDVPTPSPLIIGARIRQLLDVHALTITIISFMLQAMTMYVL